MRERKGAKEWEQRGEEKRTGEVYGAGGEERGEETRKGEKRGRKLVSVEEERRREVIPQIILHSVV